MDPFFNSWSSLAVEGSWAAHLDLNESCCNSLPYAPPHGEVLLPLDCLPLSPPMALRGPNVSWFELNKTHGLLVYLPTFPLECCHVSTNAGKYSIHGASGIGFYNPIAALRIPFLLCRN